MNLHRYIVMSVLAALVVLSCPVLATSFTFTAEDSGKTVNVNPGDTVTLTLTENPSTGFRWIMDASRGLVLKSDEYTPSNSGLIGSAGNRTWDYVVTVSGMLSISGVYKQAWMPTTGSEKDFTLTLVSGERNYKNSRTVYWWNSVPQFERILVATDKVQDMRRRFPGRFS